jgi:hypothetical protein
MTPRPSCNSCGRDIDPHDPRRFLLVRREAPVASLLLDHLSVDQDAIPTLVETKRGEDTRGRREVVAQMLDRLVYSARPPAPARSRSAAEAGVAPSSAF